MTTYKDTLKGELSLLEQCEESVNSSGSSKCLKNLPELTSGSNNLLSCCSKKLSFTSSADAGRYVIAEEIINTGDVLVVEEPYAACLLNEKSGSHCHHCFTRLLAPIPCPDCCAVAFCSLNCLEQAEYHTFECHYGDVIIGSGMSDLCRLALRMIIQSKLDLFLKFRETLTHSPNKSGMEQKLEMYLKVYNLVRHEDHRPPEDFFHRTLMAILMLKLLRDTNYFPRIRSNFRAVSDDELFIASLLLRHLQLLQFNAHEIFETVMENSRSYKNSKMVFTALAIYPTAALFNHSCYASVTRYFVGRSIVMTAIRPLKSGEEVSENYGPVFTRFDLTTRQNKLLSRYWFRCSCLPCLENWPVLTALNEDFTKFRCQSKDCQGYIPVSADVNNQKYSKCFSCNQKYLVSDMIVQLKKLQCIKERATDDMESKKVDDVISKFCLYLDGIHFLICLPNKDIHRSQDLLAKCLASKGNHWFAN